MDIQAKNYEYKMDQLKTEIHRLCDVSKWEKIYNEWELKVKDATIENLIQRCKVLSAQTKMTRAVLRLPRMSKQFHDKTRIENLPEFDCIEEIYNKHFELSAEEMKDRDRDSSPEFNKLSYAE